MSLWRFLFYQPLVNLLFGLTQIFGNLGWGVIVTSLFLRFLLAPFFILSIKDSFKLQKLLPKLQSLREKYRGNLLKMAQAQSQLYQKAGINPLVNLSNQVLQIIFLIAFYSSLQTVLKAAADPQSLSLLLYPPLQKLAQKPINLHFWYLRLDQPDLINWRGFILPGFFLWLAVFAQWRSLVRTTPTGGNPWIFVFLTLIFGVGFPAGIIIYWAVFSFLAWLQLEATHWFLTRFSKDKKSSNQNQKSKT